VNKRNGFLISSVLGALLFCGANAQAAGDPQPGHPHDLGVGVVLGAPTGLTAKYWMTDMLAFDGAVAWHFGDDDRFQIHSDALWHFMVPNLTVPEGTLPLYVGMGLRVLAGDHSEAGIRIPFGVSYLLAHAPLEFFAEIAPVVEFAPDTDAGVDGGVGLRFYFK
jgi:hypothetical protein